ncbi:MAG: hypothetical protein HY392_04715 [Candidatus Diapherotrites archaeon]|nr:hypothetical protein [Candidatus Diapherotrites archaeon]
MVDARTVALKKARRAWQSMTHEERARAQPEGRYRKKPGTTWKGKYFRVRVRPTGDFSSFRAHDVGRKGHILRIAGRRPSGSWDTQSWLISKNDAHRAGDTLVGDSPSARKVLESLPGKETRLKGDVFEGKPRRDIPEREKPTPAQQRAQRRNIKKAQKARHKS